MAKELLNMKFANYNGHNVEYVLGCNSIDNFTGTLNTTYYSKDNPLGQVGCLMYTSMYGLSGTANDNLFYALYQAGYNPKVLMPAFANASWTNIKFYLGGYPTDADNNPMPYIMFNDTSYNNRPHYFSADGTDMGVLFDYDPAATGWNCLLLGKLYTDGTFKGDWGSVRAHTITPGVYSKKYYDYYITAKNIEVQLIPTEIIEDLAEYIPLEPEGMNSDNDEGDFDASSDAIGIPGVPGISVLDTGMVNMYQYTSSATDIQRLKDFGNLLWDPTGFIANILAIFQNPMEGVLNLSMCPIVMGPQYLVANQSVVIGNFTFPGISADQLTQPYKRIDFGTIWLNEFWGNFADWSPYTTCSIYLPYVGVQQLSINDLMGGGVNLWANCDVFTGSIQYFLFSAQNNPRAHGHQSVLYSWTGNMKYNIPVTGTDFNEAIIRGISDTVSAGISSATSLASGNPSIPNPMSLIGHASVYSRGAGSGGSPGSLGCQYPYLILERPELTMAENYDHTVGVPNETTDYIKNYSGFVKVRGIHIEIASATSNEISEIENLLKGGVIV